MAALVDAAVLGASPDAPRAMKGIGMKLISTDHHYSGTVVDIVEYRTLPGGGLEALVLVDEPHAWYSGLWPVTVDGEDLRLLLAVQSMPRPPRIGGRI
ncbi:hypothetical protein [Rhodococcus sp. IEGM 1374]|uniref:hypothetical protein n=1 Tax=Rhodococcus sp. IEGM 1374 TaxID=3082221 RepID=UPI002953D1C0|nr:hypothetical protein [Rhodococcus sp. IEGM 1374]MDV7991613.1 hypothetical protein [Rhodococcus sp. IEGM 1374]